MQDEDQGGQVTTVQPRPSQPDERYLAAFTRLAVKSLGFILPSSLSVVGLATKASYQVDHREVNDTVNDS